MGVTMGCVLQKWSIFLSVSMIRKKNLTKSNLRKERVSVFLYFQKSQSGMEKCQGRNSSLDPDGKTASYPTHHYPLLLNKLAAKKVSTKFGECCRWLGPYWFKLYKCWYTVQDHFPGDNVTVLLLPLTFKTISTNILIEHQSNISTLSMKLPSHVIPGCQQRP